jgi:hypothetical protein
MGARAEAEGPLSAHGFTRWVKAQRANPGGAAALPEIPQRLSDGFKKKINPIVVVEAVETGEIDGYPCAYRRFLRERPGEGGYPVGEIGSFSTVSRAWGKVMAVIGRFQPPVFLL